MVEVDQRNEWRQFSESPWISVEVALPHEMAEAEVLLQVLTRVTEPVHEIGSTHCNQTVELVAGGGFEPPTFGL
jgi:hypothetical protein